ncbi:XrtA-associated tyrosine autokinase [Agarivorans sp. 1_MG-2023]|uniref:XrtA-associated tyrosine autokinase n=1 Tax=Agarivorans sp. 1_MG-2023 TaxID=3062634 RepID=UPI0026E1BAF2|nr:XrtA-associated tyrosine autokinase [Agarivorans sp. 1_MG-2023]MDO6763573.1 XrtA-associated tyrosine autokinase [Agarivorans sp. 1_MG-2023]
MSTIEKAMGKLAKQAQANQAPIDVPAAEQAAVPGTEAATTPSKRVDKPVLQIDSAVLKRLGMLSDIRSRETRMLSDEYRGIKRKLLKNAFEPGLIPQNKSNLIMVTSANPGEGKTFTSINLALSLALEKDKTVLLIDSDVLKPTVSKTLGIGQHMGLMEYLLGQTNDVADVIYHTNIPNLRIMPAGMPHHLSNELLASEKMRSLTQELNSRYSDRVVLFDSPPILGVNETVVLSNFIGQAVVVVEQDSTKMAAIKSAVSQFSEELAIGYVLNKAVHGKTGTYGYGYGYGYGYEEERSA